MIKNILDINDLSFGGKAYGLNKLTKLNVKVPSAYAINQDSIDMIINGDKNAIEELNNMVGELNQ